MLTFVQLRRLLEDAPFNCTCVCVIGEDEVIDPTDPDVLVPAVYAFMRPLGGPPLLSTIPIYHVNLPIPPLVLRSFLARLHIRPEELGLAP